MPFKEARVGFFFLFFGAAIRKFHSIFAQLHLTIECVKMDLNLERNNDGSFTQPFLITKRICAKHLGIQQTRAPQVKNGF